MSGGAIGADYEWGESALLNGHDVIHFSFAGHNSNCDESLLYRLSSADLLESETWLMKAKYNLKRHYPSKSNYVNNLLRRNYYQIKETDAVYAIGTFNSRSGRVDGGTSWATEMYGLIHDKPFYFFHQDNNKWYEKHINGWQKEIRSPPKPTMGVWTGIGTRNINMNGKMAIDLLMNG